MRDRDSIDYRNHLRHVLPETLSQKEMNIIMHSHISNWPLAIKRKMVDLEFMTPDGELTPKGEILFEGLQEDNIFRSVD